MSEERVVESRRQQGARGISGAIILIGIGVAFLLQNLGVVSFDWFQLLRYWPVLLILFGIDLLLGRSLLGSLIAALVGLVLVTGVLWIASEDAPPATVLSGRAVTREVEPIQLADADTVIIDLNIGAAQVNVDAEAGPGLVVEGDYRTDEELLLLTDYDVAAGSGELILTQETAAGDNWIGTGVTGEINLSLTDEVPVDLNVDAGASDLNLDLRGMELRSLSINGGVGTIDVLLPEEGNIEVDISGGIGTVNVVVPDSLEASVSVDGLTTVDLAPRFDEAGERLWVTEGFDGAENRVVIKISTGIGTVNIE